MATVALEPEVRKNPLHRQLAAVRRQMRTVTLVRGISFAIAILIVITLIACACDWIVHLPGAVRVCLLGLALGATGTLVYALIVRPLTDRTDDLSLALRIEKQYPALNDSLASAVQFLEHTRHAGAESPSMRLEATRRTFTLIKHCDFGKIVDSRGTVAGVMYAIGSVILAGVCFFFWPAQARTALARLAYPFGTLEWPKQTLLEVTSTASKIGRNRRYEIRGFVQGVIPDKATIRVRTDSKNSESGSADIVTDENGEHVFSYEVVKDRSFSYQVRANDAVSEWHNVEVLLPPVLVPIGEKSTPMVHLIYPKYTALAEEDQQEGMGDIKAPLGTEVVFRAAANRPLKQAWIELCPELDQTDAVTFLREIGKKIPAHFDDENRQQFTIQFKPRARGQYALYFEDDNEMWDRRYFELRLLPDPAPVIELLEPTSSRQSLSMLPTAQFSLRGAARDDLFSVRNVWLEYRTKKEEPPRRIELDTIDQLAAADRAKMNENRKLIKIDRGFKVRDFSHFDATLLKTGDVLWLTVAADDFDDVTFNKQPGRSNEIEIHIIDQNDLDVIMAKDQGKLQKELEKLLEQQRQALKKQEKAAATLEDKKSLEREDLDQLSQVEQLEQQIRESIGKTKDEGLRAELQRLRQTLKDNKQPSSSTQERLDELARELDRLATDDLQQIDPHISNARKLQETAANDPSTRDKTLDQLELAERHEKNVEKTLETLLKRFEDTGNLLAQRGELKELLGEQRDLQRRTQERNASTAPGETVQDLDPKEREKLERLADDQKRLQEKTDNLLERLEKLAKEEEKKDPKAAQEIRDAVKQAKDGNLSGLMQKARDEIRKNQLNNARDAQQKAAETLEKLIRSIEDKREAELERLLKKMKEQQELLEKLSADQERLRKKIEEAGKIADPAQREAALNKLAAEQASLMKRAQDIQNELRKLSRQRGEKADEGVDQAIKNMEKALQRLQRGQMPEKEPDETLDRLDDAQRELRKAKDDAEEELAREQLARVGETIRQLKERQAALAEEADRIKITGERDRWSRGLLASLKTLADNQKDLGAETGRLAEENLAGARIVAHLLEKAAKDMSNAAERLKAQQNAAGGDADDTLQLKEAQRKQRDAIHKLEQVVDALQPEAGVPVRQPPKQPQGSGDGSGQPKGRSGGDADAIPDLAQLKLLRVLQQDVNQQSHEFMKKHPDLSKLTPQEVEELRQLRKQQQEIGDLYEELVRKNSEEKKP